MNWILWDLGLLFESQRQVHYEDELGPPPPLKKSEIDIGWSKEIQNVESNDWLSIYILLAHAVMSVDCHGPMDFLMRLVNSSLHL